MKSRLWFMLVALVVVQAGRASAGTLPGSIVDKALLVSEDMSRWSTGVTGEYITRNIRGDVLGSDQIETISGAAYLGYDVLSWLTVFITAGAGATKGVSTVTDDYGDAQFKWSVGIHAYLWYHDVTEPEIAEGRLSWKIMSELARYEFDGDVEDVAWTDGFTAMLLGYEIFSNKPKWSGVEDFYSLGFYVGPAVSYIQGSVDSAAVSDDFDGSADVGAVGGLEFFLAPNMSLNGYVQWFDELTGTGSFRFHF